MTASPGCETGVSALDHAHGRRLAGDRPGALQIATAILQASPSDAPAAYLVAKLLWESERPKLVAAAALELVERFVRRGDLGCAVLCAQLAGDAGGDKAAALASIARAFGAGSARVGEGAAPPPPLPSPVHDSELSGDALWAAAERALAHALTELDIVPEDTLLPRLPLFGALAPAILVKLLDALALHEYPAGAPVVRQGEEGLAAFLLARGVLNVVRDAATAGETLLAVLGPGAVFGEMALVSRAPRGASVFSVEPAQVLSVSRARIETLAEREPLIGSELGRFAQQRMLANLVRHSPLFSAVEATQRHALAARFTARSFQPGDHLLRREQEGGSLFVVASGLVEVRSWDEDGDPVVVAQPGPGEVVGEISLVLRRPAMADVIALHSTVALELTWSEFHDAIRDYPGLLQQLYETATQREQETRSVVAQPALDVSDIVLL